MGASRAGLVTTITLLGAGVVVAVIAALPPMPQVMNPVRATGTSARTPSSVKEVAGTPTGAGADSGAVDPSVFAPNACVAFAPLQGNVKKTVFLDAGHGGPDPGAVGTTTDGTTIDEKQLTLPVVLDATQLLRQHGYRVVVSRTVDTAVAKLDPSDVNSSGETANGIHVDTVARAHCANLAGATALVSVHFDAFTDSSVGGATTIYDASRPFSTQNQSLATQLQTDITGALAAKGWTVSDRGAISDEGQGGPGLSDAAANYGHLALLGPASPGYIDEPSSMPGALVEPLFITAPDEGSIAASDAGQQTIAQGIAKAVETYVGA